MKRINEVIIWTDGSCNNRTNASGGYGVVMNFIEDGVLSTVQYYGGQYIQTTSARMEIMAALSALKKCPAETRILLNSDNEYVVKAIKEGWLWRWLNESEVRKNMDLWVQMAEEVDRIGRKNVTFQWVRGHNGNRNNEIADRLAALGGKSVREIIDLK